MDRAVSDDLVLGAPVPFADDPSTEGATGPGALVFPVAVLKDSGDQQTSAAFIRFAGTPDARSIVADAGLRPLP
jgi:hypothetical protein